MSLLDEFEKAEALRDKMKELGFPSVFLNEAQMNGRTWYTVDLGYFSEEDAALKLALKLKAKGHVDRYLIRKTSDLSQ